MLSRPCGRPKTLLEEYFCRAGAISDVAGDGVESRMPLECRHAPVAQLDRVLGFEPSGREFESLRARHFSGVYSDFTDDQRIATQSPRRKFRIPIPFPGSPRIG